MAAGSWGFDTWKGRTRRGYARSGTAFAKRVDRRKQRRLGKQIVREGLLEDRAPVEVDFYDVLGVALEPWQRTVLVLISAARTTWCLRPRA
jgi:hypothetical protein